MPTDAEIEAVLDAFLADQDWRSAPGTEADDWRSDMAAALTAAEKVREGPGSPHFRVDQHEPEEAGIEIATKYDLEIWLCRPGKGPTPNSIRADERAKVRERHEREHLQAFEDGYGRGRIDTLAKVRERVEAERLEETDDPTAGLSATGRAADRAYNRAIDDALTAIEGADDE